MSAGLSSNAGFVAWRVRQQQHVEQALSNWVPADAPAGMPGGMEDF